MSPGIQLVFLEEMPTGIQLLQYSQNQCNLEYSYSIPTGILLVFIEEMSTQIQLVFLEEISTQIQLVFLEKMTGIYLVFLEEMSTGIQSIPNKISNEVQLVFLEKCQLQNSQYSQNKCQLEYSQYSQKKCQADISRRNVNWNRAGNYINMTAVIQLVFQEEISTGKELEFIEKMLTGIELVQSYNVQYSSKKCQLEQI